MYVNKGRKIQIIKHAQSRDVIFRALDLKFSGTLCDIYFTFSGRDYPRCATPEPWLFY